MKVVRSEKKVRHEKTSFTMRLDDELLKRVDRVAADARISRQKLIEAVIKKALSEKDFSVEVE